MQHASSNAASTSALTGGTTALVTPQNWLFLGTYTEASRAASCKTLRGTLWRGSGRDAFRDYELVRLSTSCLSLLRRSAPQRHTICMDSDVDAASNRQTKRPTLLRTRCHSCSAQQAQLENPDARIALEDIGLTSAIARSARRAFRGLQQATIHDFVRCFWEIADVHDRLGVSSKRRSNATLHFGGREQCLLWEDGRGNCTSCERFEAAAQCRSTWRSAWGQQGCCDQPDGRACQCTLYTGEMFDNNVAVIVPKNEQHLAGNLVLLLVARISRRSSED